MQSNYSYGMERQEENLKANDVDHTKWTNPLESQWVLSWSMPIVWLTALQITERSVHEDFLHLWPWTTD